VDLAGGAASFPSDPIPFIFESGGFMTCPLSTIEPTSAGMTITLQGTPHLYTAPGQTTSWASYSATATCTAVDGGTATCSLDFSGIHANAIRFLAAPTGDGGQLGGANSPCEMNPKGNY
jgi:hypothetical protein